MSSNRKGIILAGGVGSRLHPATLAMSKQLMPVYDKPMIYYPLCVLMMAGITEISLISTPTDLPRFKLLLGNGEQWGLSITFIEQRKPEGIAQAFTLAEKFLDGSSCALILGDNVFYGDNLQHLLASASQQSIGATIFAYHVTDPDRYGVVEFDEASNVLSIEEKPLHPKSNFAVTGLYFYDNNVVELSRQISPSGRGELEITDVNKCYLARSELKVQLLRRGYAWLDTGTHDSLLDASHFISTLEKRQGLKICAPEEIAYKNGLIDSKQLEKLANRMSGNNYGRYLLGLLDDVN